MITKIIKLCVFLWQQHTPSCSRVVRDSHAGNSHANIINYYYYNFIICIHTDLHKYAPRIHYAVSCVSCGARTVAHYKISDILFLLMKRGWKTGRVCDTVKTLWMSAVVLGERSRTLHANNNLVYCGQI